MVPSANPRAVFSASVLRYPFGGSLVHRTVAEVFRQPRRPAAAAPAHTPSQQLQEPPARCSTARHCRPRVPQLENSQTAGTTVVPCAVSATVARSAAVGNTCAGARTAGQRALAAHALRRGRTSFVGARAALKCGESFSALLPRRRPSPARRRAPPARALFRALYCVHMYAPAL